MPRTPVKRAVDAFYSHENSKYSCIYCKWSFRGGQLRRKLEHLLDIGTTVVGCTKKGDICEEDNLKLMAEYKGLNEKRDDMKEKRKLLVDEAEKIKLPKRMRVGGQTIDKDEIDMEYCRLMVMTTVRSTFMDSPFSLLFFENNFGYTRPSRRKVYRDLLPVLYKDTEEKVKKMCRFDKPDTFCTIATDGWEAPNGTHLRNYMIITDRHAFLHSATNSGSKCMNAKAIADEICNVIEDIGPDNVAAVTTDNASSETTSWDTIMHKYPSILCTGCSAHGGSLMFKDICKHRWAVSITDDATFLAKFLRRHQWITAELRARKVRMVTMHCQTRFAGIYFTVSRLVELQTPIGEIIISEEYQSKKYEHGDEAYRLVVDQNFWSKMKTFLALLKPVKDFIRMMDSTRHMTEHFHGALKKMKQEWTEIKGNSTGMKGHCLNVLKERWKWMEFPIHYATYALSPYYHEDSIFHIRTAMDGVHYIVPLFAEAEGVNASTALQELTDYKENCDDDILPPRAANLTDATTLSSKAWWQLHGCKWPNLQRIAIRCFSVGSSTSTSERNWSTLGHIWNSRSANRTFNSAAQVAYCNFNINSIYMGNVGRQTGFGDDDDEDSGSEMSEIEDDDD